VCAWARRTASQQAGVLDFVRQAMGDHRVVPVDQRGKPVVVPQQIPLRASLALGLDDNAHARIVALVLDAIQSPALKAHAAGLAQADTIEGAVGASGKRLGQHRVQVLGQPRDAQLPCQLVKGILGKAVAFPQGRKGSPPLLLLRPGNGAGTLPGRSGAHAAQAPLSCREHSVIELPPHFQVGA
jgi:hypothetical protein